jgi:hypothetical protein
MSMSSDEQQMLSRAAVIEPNVLSNEFMVFCPACKSFETIWFNNGVLNQTRKFTQYGNHIYHDCGSNEPCRLYITV